MQIRDFRHQYIVSLADVSVHTVKNKMVMDGFACHQLMLADKPGYAISQETCETSFGAGDVIFAAAGKLLGLRCDGEMKIRHIAFTARRLRPMLHYCGFGEFRVIPMPKENDIDRRFDDIFSCSGMMRENGAEVSARLFSLLGYLGAIRIEADNYIYDKRSLLIKPIIDYMQKNYRKAELPFTDLLSSIGISRAEADTLFSDVFSVTADEYYKKLRMENAKHMLFCEPKKGAGIVAPELGYDNKDDFCADFRDVFGIEPQEFISLYRA